MSPTASEKWECNVLKGTCKFGGKISQIKMPELYDQLYMVANNPTKFQQNRFGGIRGVASTKCSYVVMH